MARLSSYVTHPDGSTRTRKVPHYDASCARSESVLGTGLYRHPNHAPSNAPRRKHTAQSDRGFHPTDSYHPFYKNSFRTPLRTGRRTQGRILIDKILSYQLSRLLMCATDREPPCRTQRALRNAPSSRRSWRWLLLPVLRTCPSACRRRVACPNAPAPPTSP